MKPHAAWLTPGGRLAILALPPTGQTEIKLVMRRNLTQIKKLTFLKSNTDCLAMYWKDGGRWGVGGGGGVSCARGGAWRRGVRLFLLSTSVLLCYAMLCYATLCYAEHLDLLSSPILSHGWGGERGDGRVGGMGE